MSIQKFCRCEICGNLVGMLHDSGAPLVCCGQPMKILTANTVEASQEKHIPLATVQDGAVIVDVGSVAHPMIDAHYIEWVYVQTAHGGQRKTLKPGDAPHLEFCVSGDKPVAVYAYCNLHGLWKADL